MVEQVIKATERELLEDLLNTQEASVRRSFAQFLQDIRSDRALRMVRTQLEQGNIEGAMRIADSYIVRMGNVIPELVRSSGNAAMAQLAEQVGAAAVGVGFNAAYPAAAALMRQNRLEFITNITQQTRDALRPILTEALNTGQGPVAASRLFRQFIGLNRPQTLAARAFRRALEQGATDALDYALRDRRFDRTLERAVATEAPLTKEQIDRMVERYIQRALALRAETIARTESTRALAQAQDIATQQIIEKTGIDPSRVVRVWGATMDKRTRDTHRELDGQERGLTVPFDSPSGAKLMYPGDPTAPAAEVINCRCVIINRIKPPQRSAS